MSDDFFLFHAVGFRPGSIDCFLRVGLFDCIPVGIVFGLPADNLVEMDSFSFVASTVLQFAPGSLSVDVVGIAETGTVGSSTVEVVFVGRPLIVADAEVVGSVVVSDALWCSMLKWPFTPVLKPFKCSVPPS